AFQCLADQVNGLGLAARSFRCGVVVDVLWRDDDLDGWRLVEFLEFLRGVLCLRWAATAKHVDFLGLVVLEGLVDVVWDFSNQQLIGGLRQDAGNVQRHVTHANNGDGLSAYAPFAHEDWDALVEAHELSGAEAAVEIFTRHTHDLVLGGAGSEDDGVVVFVHFIDGDVAADFNVAEEANLILFHHVVQRLHDALDAWVVRGNAVADEAKWCWHLLKQVNLDVQFRFHQKVRSVNAGRARANDSNPGRLVGRVYVRGGAHRKIRLLDNSNSA